MTQELNKILFDNLPLFDQLLTFQTKEHLERTCHPIWRFLIFGVKQYVVIDTYSAVSTVDISHIARVLVEVVTVGTRVARLTHAAFSAVDHNVPLQKSEIKTFQVKKNSQKSSRQAHLDKALGGR